MSVTNLLEDVIAFDDEAWANAIGRLHQEDPITNLWIGAVGYRVVAEGPSFTLEQMSRYGTMHLQPEPWQPTAVFRVNGEKKEPTIDASRFKDVSIVRTASGREFRRPGTVYTNMLLDVPDNMDYLVADYVNAYADNRRWLGATDNDRTREIVTRIQQLNGRGTKFDKDLIEEIVKSYAHKNTRPIYALSHEIVEYIETTILQQIIDERDDLYKFVDSSIYAPNNGQVITIACTAAMAFIRDGLGIEISELGDLLIELIDVAGPMYRRGTDEPLPEPAPRPVALRLDEDGLLYSLDAPAIEYAPEYADMNLYYVRDHEIESELFLNRDLITADYIDAIHNAEERRAYMDLIGGAGGYITRRGLKPLDTDRDWGDLFGYYQDVDNGGWDRWDDSVLVDGKLPVRYLRLFNETPEPDGTRREYWFRMPPEVNTSREAFKWHFQLTDSELDAMSERA